MMERWERMMPEQREPFREGMRGRRGSFGSPVASPAQNRGLIFLLPRPPSMDRRAVTMRSAPLTMDGCDARMFTMTVKISP